MNRNLKQNQAARVGYAAKCTAAALAVGLLAGNGGRLGAHVGRHDHAAALHQQVSLAATQTSTPAAPETMTDIAGSTGADRYWAAGLTGGGVDVAVIDSGVTPVGPLAAPGKVIYGPDFSGDAASPDTANLDLVGHGTHIAGIIAGNDRTSGYSGMAPDARIVSLKVADADGTTEVGRVLQAITWVVDHKDDAGMHVRVLNLSLGGAASSDYQRSLLAAAVERAWQAGITVVVAAGNDGKTSKQLNDPAFDPFVVAVGAADTQGTVDVRDDDVAAFSSAGSGSRVADVMAPGVRVQGVRVPGSVIDDQAPSADGSPFVNGSGTSQAAAVVSGAAALVLSQHPDFSPDDVKDALTAGAVKMHTSGVKLQGTTELQLADPTAGSHGTSHATSQKWKTTKVSDADLAAATQAAAGNVNANGVRWNGVRWNGVRWNGVRWNGVRWNGAGWD